MEERQSCFHSVICLTTESVASSEESSCLLSLLCFFLFFFLNEAQSRLFMMLNTYGWQVSASAEL